MILTVCKSNPPLLAPEVLTFVIPNKRQLLKHATKVLDLCALVISFIAAAALLDLPRSGMSFAEFLTIRVQLKNVLLFALLLFSWYSIFVLCGLYVSKRLTRRRTQIAEICKATLLAAAFLLVTTKMFRIHMVTVAFSLIFMSVCTLVMIVGRLLARSLLISVRNRGRNCRYVLIVGTNERATEFADQIKMHPELGYAIVGFVDDDWPGIRTFKASGHVRCCSFEHLADFLRHNVVDEAAIYLPLRSYYEHAAQLVSLCEQHGIAIRFDTRIFTLQRGQIPASDFEDSSQLFVDASIGLGSVLVKRVIDCILSALLLILFAPLLLVVAVLVKCTSSGPILFRQTRVGLNKRQFSMYKFRTMIANAEQIQDELLAMNEMSGPVFKIKHDPRVTPFGRFLRKTSLDEFPQLFNVLTGDMSLVGPRAMSLRDYRLFNEDWQRRRFSVKPGITCLWQINGRSSIPFEKWMEMDMQYIDKWSLWLDLKILARTVPAVLRGTGAA